MSNDYAIKNYISIKICHDYLFCIFSECTRKCYVPMTTPVPFCVALLSIQKMKGGKNSYFSIMEWEVFK